MGILRRIVDMTKAAAHEVLDKVENPTVMMTQYLRDLSQQIEQAEYAVTDQKAQQRILQSKLDGLHGQITFYHEKAEQAAMEERELDARAALEAKLLYQEHYDDVYRTKLVTAQATIELEQRVNDLKEEHARLSGKRSELANRLEKVNINSPLSNHLQASLASQGFNRIEQKIMEWEAKQELAGSHTSYSSYASTSSSHSSAADTNAEQQQEARKLHIEKELQRMMHKQESEAVSTQN